ncbi:MAG: hypothetical protein U9Q27_02820 [Patescibacteria group bacterium]|nr:hypothetical protein [Patescibacteria group bacterium]
MLELIASIIFLISILGTGIILFRKIPVLVDLPILGQEQKSLFERAKIEIEELNLPARISLRKALKIFFKEFHILIFKIENKAGHCLEKMKKNSNQKNQTQKAMSQSNRLNNNNYWEEIKKHKEKKNK